MRGAEDLVVGEEGGAAAVAPVARRALALLRQLPGELAGGRVLPPDDTPVGERGEELGRGARLDWAHGKNRSIWFSMPYCTYLW